MRYLAHTTFTTFVTRNFRTRTAKWAATGLVFIDRESLDVLRITVDSLMPASFPATGNHSVVDYARRQVADKEYLLPARTVNWITFADGKAAKVEMEFTNYRKFAADSELKYESP